MILPLRFWGKGVFFTAKPVYEKKQMYASIIYKLKRYYKKRAVIRARKGYALDGARYAREKGLNYDENAHCRAFGERKNRNVGERQARPRRRRSKKADKRRLPSQKEKNLLVSRDRQNQLT